MALQGVTDRIQVKYYSGLHIHPAIPGKYFSSLTIYRRNPGKTISLYCHLTVINTNEIGNKINKIMYGYWWRKKLVDKSIK